MFGDKKLTNPVTKKEIGKGGGVMSRIGPNRDEGLSSSKRSERNYQKQEKPNYMEGDDKVASNKMERLNKRRSRSSVQESHKRWNREVNEVIDDIQTWNSFESDTDLDEEQIRERNEKKFADEIQDELNDQSQAIDIEEFEIDKKEKKDKAA